MKPDPTDPFDRPATIHAAPEPPRRTPFAAVGLLFGGATLLGAGVLLGHGLRPGQPPFAFVPPGVITEPVVLAPPVDVSPPVVVGADITAPIGERRPRVEVAFVLDTTGSMGGLLKSAKEKVWSVVDALASEPSLRGPDGKPSISLSLVAFRDRGDDYVTQVTPLTADLDGFYARLHALRAGGGGDAPEAVTEALEAAVDRLGWSEVPGDCGMNHADPCATQLLRAATDRTARVIFLVGDAPGHDLASAARAVERARARGIAVSTIQCGQDEQARAHLTTLARQGGGQALAIGQRAQVVAVQTPFDGPIAEQQRRIEATVVAWGSRAQREALGQQQTLNDSLGSEAYAWRASAQCKTGRTYDADLVQAVADGRVKAADVKVEELSDPQQRLKVWGSVECLVQAMTEERKAANAELTRLVRERDAWLAANRPAAQGTFDVELLRCLRLHLNHAGIRSGC